MVFFYSGSGKKGGSRSENNIAGSVRRHEIAASDIDDGFGFRLIFADLKPVEQRDGLHDGFNVVIAVLPARADPQKKVDFGRCENCNFFHMYEDLRFLY